ncbi:MAG: N-acetylmuramoyl-L-alanine amidase [Richelia sp.]|nr:N-acetylmuramoyl-L-alanine amidase [Richelia sp.]
MEVTVCNPNKARSVRHSLSQRCYAANISGADYYVSLDFNAFNGKAYGAEIFAVSPKGKAFRAAILSRICELGFRNRGVKNGRKYYVIKHTSMPAVILEGCFADNKEDMERLDLDKMAQAISQGILQMRKQASSFDPTQKKSA